MGEIKIYPIGQEEAEKAGQFLVKEAEETLAKGLPLTALVAVIDGEAVGALAGAINEHIFEIWSLYVEPGHRRKGQEGRLLRHWKSSLKVWPEIRQVWPECRSGQDIPP